MHNLLFLVILLIACAVKAGLSGGDNAASPVTPVSAPSPNVLPYEGDAEPVCPDTQPIRPARRRARQSANAQGVSLPGTVVFSVSTATSVPC